MRVKTNCKAGISCTPGNYTGGIIPAATGGTVN